MQTALASLSEGLLAAVDLACVRFGPGVREIVLDEVLLECKCLRAGCALEWFLDLVRFHVALQAILGLEQLGAVEDVAFELFVAVELHAF